MNTPIMSVTDERWVNHCLSLIIGASERELADWKEQALKSVLQSAIDDEDCYELPAPPEEIYI